MREALILILIVLQSTLLNSDSTQKNKIIDNQRVSEWEYVYSIAGVGLKAAFKNDPYVISRKDFFAKRYANVIVKYSQRYNLDASIMARQIFAESSYNWNAISYVRDKRGRCVTNSLGEKIPIAYGPAQIRPKYWSHLLYRVDGGKLSKRLRSQGRPNYTRYLKKIGYGIEVHSMIMRNLLNKHNQDYKKALLDYWAGSGSAQYKYWVHTKRIDKTPYITDIYYAAPLHRKLKKIHKWEIKKTLDRTSI